MKSVLKPKTLGLAGLLAAMALVVVASVGAASASAALPEFYICAKVASGETGFYPTNKCENKNTGTAFAKVKPPWTHHAGLEWCAPGAPTETGKWNSSSCTTAGTGWFKVESAAANPMAFTSTSGEKILETASGEKVKCKKDTNAGELTGPQHVIVTILFKECELVSSGGECQNKGAGTKEIETKQLTGWLYYIKEGAPIEVGMFFTATTGKEFAKFECVGPFGVKVGITIKSIEKTKLETGSCLATKVEPINEVNTTGKLVVEVEAKKQKIKVVKYEGKTFECELESEVTVLGSTKTEKSTEQEVIPPGDVITFAEPVEVKA